MHAQEAGRTALLRACLWATPPGRRVRNLALGAGERGRARPGGGTLPARAELPRGAAHGQGEAARIDGRAALPRHETGGHRRRR
eukprot:1957760-Prymnesium_polylepis.1